MRKCYSFENHMLKFIMRESCAFPQCIKLSFAYDALSIRACCLRTQYSGNIGTSSKRSQGVGPFTCWLAEVGQGLRVQVLTFAFGSTLYVSGPGSQLCKHISELSDEFEMSKVSEQKRSLRSDRPKGGIS
jgi:hypothetical protein